MRKYYQKLKFKFHHQTIFYKLPLAIFKNLLLFRNYQHNHLYLSFNYYDRVRK